MLARVQIPKLHHSSLLLLETVQQIVIISILNICLFAYLANAN